MRVLVDGDTFTCTKCLSCLPLTSFSKDKQNRTGHTYWCKTCATTNARKHHNRRVAENDVDYMRAKRSAYYMNKHGISLDEFESRLLAQGSKCAICLVDLVSSGSGTHLDHDHTTGSLRSILCTNCNRGLGHFKDSEKNLMAAIKYLQAHTDNGNQKEGRRL